MEKPYINPIEHTSGSYRSRSPTIIVQYGGFKMTPLEVYTKWKDEVENKKTNIDKLKECFSDMWYCIKELSDKD